jgi:very-short-patch-repair endonuclease
MKNLHPTKEQLNYDYFVLNMNQQQIAEKYNYRTRQVIHRLFKKYNIISKSKSELAKNNFKNKIERPTKEELKILYANNSISTIAKIFGVCRDVVSNWIDEYHIKKTYFKNNIDNEILKSELEEFSIKELCVKYKIEPNEIKRRVGNISEKTYSWEEIKNILSLYDIYSKYFARQISKDDFNVYQSVLNLTKDHILQSNKITEKLYRLLNNYKDKDVVTCKKCKSVLKFYTLKNGYGHTKHNICRNCICSISGSSKPSQELFWKLYKKLNSPKKCNFSELNNERTLYVNQIDRSTLFEYKKLNKKRYHIDFMLKNKIIEYDGEYWHNDIEKETAKNKFLKNKGYLVLHIKDSDYKKNPEKVIERCIEFLLK